MKLRADLYNLTREEAQAAVATLQAMYQRLADAHKLRAEATPPKKGSAPTPTDEQEQPPETVNIHIIDGTVMNGREYWATPPKPKPAAKKRAARRHA